MRGFFIFLLAVIAGVCGCLGSKSTNTPTVISIDRSGSYQSSDSVVSLTLPLNAYNSQRSPSIHLDSQAPAFNDTINIKPIGHSYMLTPVEAKFDQTITLNFKYSTASLPTGISPDMIRVYVFKNSAWTLFSEDPPTLDIIKNTVSVKLNNFDYPMIRLAGDIRINKLQVLSFAVTEAQKAVINFNKKLNSASAVIASNYSVTVNSVDFAVTAAAYTSNSTDVLLTIADISAEESKTAVLKVAETLKDEYDQTYETASQTDLLALQTVIDLVIDPPSALVPQPDSDPAAPGQPVIVRSNEGVTALAWQASTYLNKTDNITYTIESADDQAFSVNKKSYTTSQLSLNVALLEGTSLFGWYDSWAWTVGNPVLKTYYWRVKSDYKKGYADSQTSTWSVISNLRYDRPNEAPSTPAALKVAGSSADQNSIAIPGHTISWDASVDPEGLAVSYEVNFDITSTFDATGAVTLNGLGASSVVLTTAQAQLSDDTVYFWRVRSLDPRGGFSAWSKSSAFFFNKENDIPVITNLYPSGGQGIPYTEAGNFTADVTNTDRDTYSYTVNVYTDSAGTVSAGFFAASTLFPVDMTQITWQPGHPVEDLQQYYWKLTVTEATATLPPANAPVVSALNNFVKSNGDSKPVVTLNAPATPLSGSDHQIGEATALTWGVTDSDSSTALISSELGIFSADTDSSLLISKNLGANTTTGTITDISATHNLQSGTLYYWGVRCNDNAAFLNDSSRTSPYGDWTRHSFIYKAGPVITDVTVCNITDQVFTVLWRTDSENTTTNNLVYYTKDGSVPTLLSSSSADISGMNKVHITTVNLGASSPSTTIRFLVSSESSVIAGIRTNDTNNGSYYTVVSGQAYSGAPPSPNSLIIKFTGATDNDVFTCRFKHVRTVIGNEITLLTYNFSGVITSGKCELNQIMNRWESNDLDGTGSTIDGGAYTEMKVYDIKLHNDSGMSTVSGEYSITQEIGQFPQALIPID